MARTVPKKSVQPGVLLYSTSILEPYRCDSSFRFSRTHTRSELDQVVRKTKTKKAHRSFPLIHYDQTGLKLFAVYTARLDTYRWRRIIWRLRAERKTSQSPDGSAAPAHGRRHEVCHACGRNLRRHVQAVSGVDAPRSFVT